MNGLTGLSLLEHGQHLTERANAIEAALAEILTKLNALDFTELDVEVSSHASQASVDAISNTVGSLYNKVSALDTQLDSVEQTVDKLQANLTNCEIKIALVP